jgi:hypothetical protein
MNSPGKQPLNRSRNTALVSTCQRGAADDFALRAEVLADRRRPGRMDKVDPKLLPLLRRSERPEIVDDLPRDDSPRPEISDDLGAIAGIFVALLLAIPFWGVMAWWLWTAFLP